MSVPSRSSAEPAPLRLTRRDVLRGSLLGGVALFLAACGAQESPTGGSGGRTAPERSDMLAPSPSPRSSPSNVPPQSPSPVPSTGPSLAEKIAGLLIVGFRGETLADAPWVRTALRDQGLGGVILFDRDQASGGLRNVRSPAQVRSLTGDLRAAAGDHPILVAVDQEGGVVTRLSPKHGFPAVASEAAVGAGSATATRTWARALAATLAESGFNLNFAPVVDLDVNPESPAIGALDRSFSSDPDVVVERAAIEIEEHRRAGVRTAIKHFPGIGSSTTNTDFGVADVTATWTRRELEPFGRLIAAGSVDLVMVGHVVNRKLDPEQPASLSHAVVTELLRDELGWIGPIVTDDLQAAAITKAVGFDEAVLLALEAGNDVLLFANQQAHDPGIVDRVVSLVSGAVRSGRIPPERVDDAYRRARSLLAVPG
jgi:beta-N-acetylhexosaminidase